MTTFSLALGGGGARGLAHIHVLRACEELGVRPKRIAGSSIGAIVGAGYAAGMSADQIRDFALDSFARKGALLARLWSTRPPNLQAFLADGGPRIGQLNAERTLAAFLPPALPARFEDLSVPLDVLVTDFYARSDRVVTSGDLMSALAASAALPAIFRPVRRDGRILIDGGIFSPLPFDGLEGTADAVVAVDVNGGPDGDPAVMPGQMEAMIGASQLMMQAVIDTKVMHAPPDLLLRPPVSHYRVMDFLRSAKILEETASFKEEAKHKIAALLAMDEADREADATAVIDAGV